MNKKISVVLPCYNAEKFIEINLSSIFSQNFSNYEIVAINDGSTDKTGDILDYFSRKFSNLRVYHQTNQGEASAFINGIKFSEGEYIVRQDADDLMIPGRLKAQYDWMKANSRVDVAGSWMWSFSDDKLFKRRIITCTHSNSLPLLFSFVSQISNPTSIYRRSILNKFEIPVYKIGSDLALYLKLISSEVVLSNMPFETVFYRIHKDQATSIDKLQEIKNCVDNIYTDHKSLFLDGGKMQKFFDYGCLWRNNSLEVLNFTDLIAKDAYDFKSLNNIERMSLCLALLRILRRCSDFDIMRMPRLIKELSCIDFSFGLMFGALVSIGSIKLK